MQDERSSRGKVDESSGHASRKPEVLSPGRSRQRSVLDYMELVPDFIRDDGGPPRWFCPTDCASPPPDAPVLLFLPGMDGLGLGLILHHERLGRLFEVRCLHVPVQDRTPFEGLVQFVEQTLEEEYLLNRSKPVYMIGDSLGGALALAIAARNKHMDLILVLTNPVTSFNRSQLQPILPVLQAIPSELYNFIPYGLSFIMGDPVLMALASVESGLPPLEQLKQLRDNLVAMLPTLSNIATIIPKDALAWKLRLLQSAAAYANSRLHAVKADVMILASGRDQMLPSADEARRLSNLLKNCKVRSFNNNGHTLLLEKGFQLATLIKASGLYRHSRAFDFVRDFVPPTLGEFEEVEEEYKLLQKWLSPVFFSTSRNGKVENGLAGVPKEGPTLFVGNHTLMGLESTFLVMEFLKQRSQLVRGIAHPFIFMNKFNRNSESLADRLRLFGAVPVSGKNLFKLLSQKESVLLYPGGGREAFHRKGEAHMLFWPEQAEFVRMAAYFDATIVPFSVVGEDKIFELLLDYDDFKKVPFLQAALEKANANIPKLRNEEQGEVANQPPHIPIVLPKLGGRLYVLFGKPFSTSKTDVALQNRDKINKLYLDIKGEVEAGIKYLLSSREDDPYKDLPPRILYESTWDGDKTIPTFSP